MLTSVLTKMKNDLKPARNCLKPPETSHIVVFFLLKLGYSQVEFVLILHPKVFFGRKFDFKN